MDFTTLVAGPAQAGSQSPVCQARHRPRGRCRTAGAAPADARGGRRLRLAGRARARTARPADRRRPRRRLRPRAASPASDAGGDRDRRGDRRAMPTQRRRRITLSVLLALAVPAAAAAVPAVEPPTVPSQRRWQRPCAGDARRRRTAGIDARSVAAAAAGIDGRRRDAGPGLGGRAGDGRRRRRPLPAAPRRAVADRRRLTLRRRRRRRRLRRGARADGAARAAAPRQRRCASARVQAPPRRRRRPHPRLPAPTRRPAPPSAPRAAAAGRDAAASTPPRRAATAPARASASDRRWPRWRPRRSRRRRVRAGAADRDGRRADGAGRAIARRRPRLDRPAADAPERRVAPRRGRAPRRQVAVARVGRRRPTPDRRRGSSDGRAPASRRAVVAAARRRRRRPVSAARGRGVDAGDATPAIAAASPALGGRAPTRCCAPIDAPARRALRAGAVVGRSRRPQPAGDGPDGAAVHGRQRRQRGPADPRARAPRAGGADRPRRAGERQRALPGRDAGGAALDRDPPAGAAHRPARAGPRGQGAGRDDRPDGRRERRQEPPPARPAAARRPADADAPRFEVMV